MDSPITNHGRGCILLAMPLELSSRSSPGKVSLRLSPAFAVALISLFPRLTQLTVFQRQSLCLAAASFGVLVLFLAVLSIAFDFGLCPYPSREHPYFTSGRLLSAAAVPFFLLYSEALDCVLSRIPRQWPRTILFAGIVLFIVVSQSVVNWPVFSSDYNWFHLP